MKIIVEKSEVGLKRAEGWLIVDQTEDGKYVMDNSKPDPWAKGVRAAVERYFQR